MRAGSRVGENHLTRFRVLGLARECQIGLVAGGVPDREIAVDLRKVEHRDRNREGERDRVAQIDQRMDPRQRIFLAKTPQQRFRGAAVLRRLQPHARENAAPCGYLGQFRFRAGGEP